MIKKIFDEGVPAENLEHYLTVGDLRKTIKDLPDHIPVFYQRIEDAYFQKGRGWLENGIVNVPNEMDQSDGRLDDQYIRAFCSFKTSRRGGKRILLAITAHY